MSSIENTLSTATLEDKAVFIFINTRFNASCIKHEALTCLGELAACVSKTSFTNLATLCFPYFDCLNKIIILLRSLFCFVVAAGSTQILVFSRRFNHADHLGLYFFASRFRSKLIKLVVCIRR